MYEQEDVDKILSVKTTTLNKLQVLEALPVDCAFKGRKLGIL